MDPSPPRKELSLQGPRPAALKIRHDSHKIKKPPPHKPPQHHHHHRKPSDHSDDQPRQPVIIYSVSPKVIYADESEFRSVVQRLTGPSPEFSSADVVSPAARLATVEKTRSPTDRGRLESSEELTSAVMAEGLEMSQIPGILSPAPANLPPIPAGFFSPVVESPQWQTLGSMAPDFSPNFRYGFNGGFTTSPSALFPASNISPTISYDLFNYFMDP